MNAFKNKLYHHEIKPSPKGWERIEADLDKGKIRQMPINLRWAAAAMFVFAISGAVTWKYLQKPDGQEVVQVQSLDNTPKEVLPITKPTPTVVEAPVLPNVEKPSAVKPVFAPTHRQNEENVAQIQEFYQPINPIIVEKLNLPTEKRNLENVAFLNQKKMNDLPINLKKVEISRIQDDDDDADNSESVADNPLSLPKLLSPKNDSTFTERVLAFGQQKAKQVVSRAFKPVLKRFK
jgi:hypothetical protein